MATAQLKIVGLTEFREALKKLPPDLVNEAAVIIQMSAEETARQVTAVYAQHRVTGNLVSHVRVEHTLDKAHARSRVLSTAKHAYLFEYGSKKRAWKSGKNTGVMPGAHAKIPIAVARRRIMVQALIGLVERAGLVVTRTSV